MKTSLMTTPGYKPLHLQEYILKKSTTSNLIFNAKNLNAIAFETQLDCILNKIKDIILMDKTEPTMVLNWNGQIFNAYQSYLIKRQFSILNKENINENFNLTTITWDNSLKYLLIQNGFDLNNKNRISYKTKNIAFKEHSIEYEICSKAIDGHTECCFYQSIKPQTKDYLRHLGFNVTIVRKYHCFITVVNWLDA